MALCSNAATTRNPPAGEAEQDLGGTDLGAHGGDGVVDDVRRGPTARRNHRCRRTKRENAQACLVWVTSGGIARRSERAGIVGHGGDRAARGAGRDEKPAGISVTLSPWLIHTSGRTRRRRPRGPPDAVQQARLADHVDAGVAELAQVGALHLTAHLLGHGLHAVADASFSTFRSNTACGARGLSASCTDSGPPARMMPRGTRR